MFTDKAKAELIRRVAKQKSLQQGICYFSKIKGAKAKDQKLTISTGTVHGCKTSYSYGHSREDCILCFIDCIHTTFGKQ